MSTWAIEWLKGFVTKNEKIHSRKEHILDSDETSKLFISARV